MTEPGCQQYPVTLADRLGEMASARAGLLAEVKLAAEVAAGAEPGRWSVAEIVYHLYLSEKAITKMVAKVLASGFRQERASDEQLRVEWERVRRVVAGRNHKVQAPAIAVPLDAPALETGLGLLAQSRQTLLETVGDTTYADLLSIAMPHPFEAVGTLTGAGWLSLIAFHEIRHTAQVRKSLGHGSEHGG